MTDPVQIFKAISWLITKWLLIVLAGCVALSALAVGVYFAWQWYSYDRHAAAIIVQVDSNSANCSDNAYPIYVMVGNGSARTLEKTTFSLGAKKPGYSNNVAKYRLFSTDKILKPNEGWGQCWTSPGVDDYSGSVRSLEWFADFVYFKFAN